MADIAFVYYLVFFLLVDRLWAVIMVVVVRRACHRHVTLRFLCQVEENRTQETIMEVKCDVQTTGIKFLANFF